METLFLTLDKKGRATLPEEVRSELGVASGDIVILERTDRNTFELVPAALVPRDQLWFYHPEMKRRVVAAEADVAAGKVAHVRTPAEATAFLDSLKTKGRPR